MLSLPPCLTDSHEAGVCCSVTCRAWFGVTVAPFLGVLAIPFLPQTEWVKAVRSVDGQNPIEMVDLVLQ